MARSAKTARTAQAVIKARTAEGFASTLPFRSRPALKESASWRSGSARVVRFRPWRAPSVLRDEWLVSTSRLECHVAKRHVESLGLGEVVALQQGDAFALPYRSGRFDAVFTSFTLELFKEEEIPAVLAEVRRVLRRGGRLTVVSLGDGNSTTWRPRFYRWFSSRWPGLIDCRPIALPDVLKEAGFELCRVELSDVSGLPVSIAVGGNGTR